METNDEEEMTEKMFAERKTGKIKTPIQMPTCEVCKQNVSIGVYCVPSVPISCAYCEECANAGAHPWWILVSNTACIGGLAKTADWWKWMVTDTCNHLGKTLEEFNTDVQKSLNQLEEYMQKDYEKECKRLFDACKFKGTFANCKAKHCIKCHDNGPMHKYHECAGCNEEKSNELV